MGRPRAKYRRTDFKVSACLTKEAAEALAEIERENPYQGKSNILSKAVVFLHAHAPYGFNSNLDPLPAPSRGARR